MPYSSRKIPTLGDLAFDVLAKQSLFRLDLYRHTSLLDKKIHERLMPRFLQAVIDDDEKTIKALLDVNPELLLLEPMNTIEIKSQLTWQIFSAENALMMAAKRKQIKMIELLLPYFNRLEQDAELKEKAKQTREDGLKAWSFYEMRKNERGEDEIVIPKTYADCINELIDVFCRENLAPNQTDFMQLSAEAEKALSLLLDKLVPKTAVELDNHVDVELLLHAAYQLYNNRFDQFNSFEQRSAFCIRVIGLIQSALSPEMGKIFCEGISYVVEQNRPIGTLAASLKLNGGEAFYRDARESLSGLGRKFLCGARGCGIGAPGLPFRGRGLLQNLCQTKASSLENFIQHLHQQPGQPVAEPVKPVASRCVIS